MRYDMTGLEADLADVTGLCGTGGLGTATMHVTGKLRLTEGLGWSIEGTYTLYDYWDFDVRWRGAMLTAQVVAGRALLPGRPFRVVTEPVPFHTATITGNVIEHGNGAANAATSQR